MSGKPKAKPAPKAAAPAANPTPPPAAAKPAAPTAKPTTGITPPRRRTDPEPTVSSEDPFDVDTTAVRRAIKLAPKPTKQRTHEVVCPMCETPGFLSPTDAGKDVQCCNPECIVPVFRSKRVAVVEAAPESPARNWPLIAAGGVGILAVLGAATWFLLPKTPVVDPQKFTVESNDDKGPKPSLVSANQVQRGLVIKVATLEDIRQQSLKRIAEAALVKENNRNQDSGWQMTAETQAVSGDLKQATETLSQMQARPRSEPYFQVLPLVEIGWQQLRAADHAALKTTLDDALAKSANLPKTVRKTQDIVISLAALLIAADRAPEATALIDKHADFEARGELAAWWRTALESRSFNVFREAQAPWHAAMPDPLRIAVTEVLVLRGQSPAALKWLNSLQGIAARDACRAAWAGRTLQVAPDQLAAITAELSQPAVTPAGRCRAQAALGAVASGAGNETAARQHLADAIGSLNEIQPAGPLPLPGMKAIYDSDKKDRAGLPDPAPILSQALAAVDVALLQTMLNEREAAWTSFQKAYLLARGISPGPAATQKLVDDGKSQAVIRGQLQSILKVSENQSLQDYYRYMRQVGELDKEADARLAWQARFLRLAMRQGDLAQIWEWVRQVDAETDLSLKEPLLAQPELIAAHLLAKAQADGKNELVSQIQAAPAPVKIVADPLTQAAAKVWSHVDQQQWNPASELLRQTYRSDAARKQPDRVDALALSAVGIAQQQADLTQQIAFVQGLFDAVAQEEAFLLLAGTTAQTDKAPDLWKFVVETRELVPLEQIAIYRGLVAGLPASSQPKPQP